MRLIHPRRRLRIEQAIIEFFAVLLTPVALPILATMAYVQLRQYRAGTRTGGRPGTWYWRIWWWYGYNGLYQIDWGLKHLKEVRP